MNQTKKIKTNLAYLKKLFIMPNSPDKFVEFGHELLELIHDFFQEKGGIHSSATLPQLSNIFSQTSIPDSPLLIKDVMLTFSILRPSSERILQASGTVDTYSRPS